MKIEDVIKLPEGRKLEFKETLPVKADLCKTVVAFANDAGGEIFIGIKNSPREIIGIAEDHLMEMEEQISNIIHDNCYPLILPEILFINHKGKHVIVVKIYKGNNPPYYLKNKGKEKGTYIRVGSTNRPASKEIIEELERQKRNISFDSLTVHLKEINELDISIFKKHFEEVTKDKLNKTILKKLNLIEKDQNQEFPTNALILLSNDELKDKLFPYAKIECARFKGNTPGNFIDQKTIIEPLSFQAEEAYKFVLRHISQGSTYEGVYRKDRWEYPIIAIREVIRNAVIHRDYSLKGSDIKIAIFDNKIEITSPGKLMPGIDFNDMESGQSDIRNKVLAPVFKKLGIIEQWGNGLRLIAEELKKYPDIKMEWSEPGISFRITFIKRQYQHQIENKKVVSEKDYNRLQPITAEKTKVKDDYDRLRPIVDEKTKTKDNYGRLRTITDNYEELEIEEKKILLYLLNNEKIRRKEAVELLDLGKSRTFEILKVLMRKGYLKRKGNGRSTYYILKKKKTNDKK